MTQEQPTQQLTGFLGTVERVGNRLPHPFTIFVILTLLVVLLSAWLAGESMIDAKGRTVVVQNLISADGLRWFLKSCVNNFVGFKPLGLVLTMMLGLGMAERIGLLSSLLRATILGAPKSMVTAIVAFTGVIGNMAASAAFVVVPPLGAMIFKGLGRNPLVGLAVGFAGCAAGLNANVLIVGTDVGLAAITQQAVQIVTHDILVHPAVNWYFMFASTFLVTATIVVIAEKFLEPRMGGINVLEAASQEEDMTLTALERQGLRAALWGALIYIVVIALMVVPEHGILRDPKHFTVVPSPFLNSLVPILLGFFLAVSIPYGMKTGAIKSDKDAVRYMSGAMKDFAPFIVLCFAAAQFVACFGHAHLDMYFSVHGAQFLKQTGFSGIPLLLSFILLSTCVNFFIGSAMAKWALLAPIFVPMLMQMDFSPFFIQCAYRIADSATNAISPLEPFMPVVIAVAQKYSKDAGLGTIISMMLPFSIGILVIWSAFLILWMFTGMPLGPGAPLFMH